MNSVAPGHVFVLNNMDDPNLLGSYARAYKAMGWRVSNFDLDAAHYKYARLGAVGRRAAAIIPIEPWIRKANRDLYIQIQDLRPNLVLFTCTSVLLPGCVAQLKATMPECKLVFLWPDTLLNLTPNVIQSLPLFDLVGVYSSAAIMPLKGLGAREIEWVPFAADPSIFPKDVEMSRAELSRFECDVSFVGGWRPERERAILALVSAGISVKVWGTPVWMKTCRDKQQAERYFQGGPLIGAEFAKAVRGAKISLNRIDDTNYPAANMRFFESAACGGATLNSDCPEMAPIFRDGETAFYYRHENDLATVVKRLLRDDQERTRVAHEAQDLVLREHTYQHRAAFIVRRLSGS